MGSSFWDYGQIVMSLVLLGVTAVSVASWEERLGIIGICVNLSIGADAQ